MNVRPNKLAQGMTNQLERQKKIGKPHDHYQNGKGNIDALKLSVRGTLDKLGTAYGPISRRKCHCCGGTGRSGYALSDTGKLQLRRLRSRAERRKEMA